MPHPCRNGRHLRDRSAAPRRIRRLSRHSRPRVRRRRRIGSRTGPCVDRQARRRRDQHRLRPMRLVPAGSEGALRQQDGGWDSRTGWRVCRARFRSRWQPARDPRLHRRPDGRLRRADGRGVSSSRADCDRPSGARRRPGRRTPRTTDRASDRDHRSRRDCLRQTR